MSELQSERLIVGSGEASRQIAVLVRDGAEPGLFWLSGFRSDMTGAKAAHLARWAEAAGHACTRFDYSGHGRSGGRFEEGTISRWLAETVAVFDAFTSGKQIVVGSSMGGWLALLLARTIRETGRGERLAGMILIAPAVDMTETLMWNSFGAKAKRALLKEGFVSEPSNYADAPSILTLGLIEDGRNHLFGDHPIETGCPVHVIQGMQDPDVPWEHATALMEKLAFDDAVLTLVRDGDHRLSRPEDLERLTRAVEAMVAD